MKRIAAIVTVLTLALWSVAGSGSTYPSSGSYRQGDIVINNDVQTGEPVGWICVMSGSPGTWQTVGCALGKTQIIGGTIAGGGM